jgi:hypothetical protein
VGWVFCGGNLVIFYNFSASEIFPVRGVSFDGSGLIRGVSFDGSGLIRGELLYIIFRISKANHVKISIIQFDYLITRTTAI